MKGTALFVGAMALAALGNLPGANQAADPPPKGDGKGSPDLVAAFPDLVAALKKSPGCLGVETARTASGKAVIFAWFEDLYRPLGDGLSIGGRFAPDKMKAAPRKGAPGK